MKLKLSKKNAILVLIIFVVIFTSIFLILLTSKLKKHYPEQPVPIKNIGTSQKGLDISQSKINSDTQEIFLYSITPKIHTELVERIISNMGLELQKEETIENTYFVWSNGKNKFSYESIGDTVSFQLTSSVSITKSEKVFDEIYNQYLGLDHEFIIKNEDKSENITTLYASRLIEGIPIEGGNGQEYSDILSFDSNGKLIAGQLLLTEFVQSNLTLPLITQQNIEQYINLDEYPKERYVDTSVLSSVVVEDYLDNIWFELEESATDCKADSADLILLYKNSNQQYLLPAYKYYSNCKVEYDNKEYTVPSIFYISASDPRFVTID